MVLVDDFYNIMCTHTDQRFMWVKQVIWSFPIQTAIYSQLGTLKKLVRTFRDFTTLRFEIQCFFFILFVFTINFQTHRNFERTMNIQMYTLHLDSPYINLLPHFSHIYTYIRCLLCVYMHIYICFWDFLFLIHLKVSCIYHYMLPINVSAHIS